MQAINANTAYFSCMKQGQRGYAVGVMELVDFLNQWFNENSQAKFAELAGVQQSTVSRWKNSKTPPSFESCLRIARAMGKSPIEIFEAVGRSEFIDLFKYFFPNAAASNTAPRPKKLRDAVARLESLHELNPRAFQSVARTIDDWLADESRNESEKPPSKNTMEKAG